MRQIGSFSRGLRMLAYIAVRPEGVRIAELAAAFNMPSSNLSLFMNSMVAEGFILKDAAQGRYFLSQHVVALFSNQAQDLFMDVRRVARPLMKELSDLFDENVLLGVIQSGRLSFIESIQSRRFVQILNAKDATFPPHVTASGKCILAFWPEPKAREHLAGVEYPKYTPLTKVTPEEILKDLGEIRKSGWALNPGEYEPEIMALAAPVFDVSGVVASLTVQFPTSRYKVADLKDKKEAIVSRAAHMSRLLQGMAGGSPTENGSAGSRIAPVTGVASKRATSRERHAPKKRIAKNPRAEGRKNS